jgi:hypothetical protein
MSAWRDLEAQFHQLEPSMEKARLEHQKEEASERWQLGGTVDLDAAKRFRVLAAEAGALLESSAVVVPAEVASETDPAKRWFRALWHMAGPHDAPIAGLMSQHGRSAGRVSTGQVRRPAHTSAALALRFQAADHR